MSPAARRVVVPQFEVGIKLARAESLRRKENWYVFLAALRLCVIFFSPHKKTLTFILIKVLPGGF